MLLGGLCGVVASAVGSRSFVPGIVLLVYIPFGALYIFPAVFLSRYASCITRLLQIRRSEDLEAALAAQKSFWKFIGITIVVVLCIYLAGVVIALAVAGIGGAGLFR